MTIRVGDTVKRTRAKSINHFKSVGMSIKGVVTKIVEDNYVGVYRRPYFIKFSDRSRERSYAINEIKKCKVKQ